MSKKRNNKVITVIVVIIAAIAAIIGILWKTGTIEKIADYLSWNPAINEHWEEDLLSRKYIGEVYYTGPFKYPEVYDRAFGSGEKYVMNKEYPPEHKEEICNAVRAYYAQMYSDGYRKIVEDANAYRTGMLQYFDEDSTIIVNTFPVTDGAGDYITPSDYVEMLSDYIVENRINAKSEFITNESLVYKYGYIYVRGVVETTIFDTDIQDIQKGKVSTEMVDVAVKPGETEGEWKICTITRTFTDEENARWESEHEGAEFVEGEATE